MKKSKRNLQYEKLEQKQLLAGDLFVVGPTLFITGDNGDNIVQVDQTKLTNTVTATFDGVSATYDNISNVVVRANGGNDNISINTFDDPGFLISSQVYGGDGDDIIQGGGGSDYLDGGAGDDVVSNFVTDAAYNPIGKGSLDTLVGGSGNDSLWGGWGVQDIIFGGDGNDLIYDIVGGAGYIDGGAGDDLTVNRTGVGLPTDPLNNPGVVVSDVLEQDKQDSSVVAFDAGTQAGGAPVQIGSTLYVVNLDGGDIAVNQTKKDVTVTYDGVDFGFQSKGITAIAGLGGPTNDIFVNNTNIKSVFYGLGGDDVLLGGSNTDILKGGDGNDTVVGNGGSDDITGDAGVDIMIGNDKKKDIVRVDAFDRVFADDFDTIVLKTFSNFS